MFRVVKLSLLIGVVLATQGVQASNPADLLPAGTNRELVVALCSGCHSLQLVAQNRLSRDAWDRTLRMMETKHKLTFFNPELRTQVLEYLATVLTPTGADSKLRDGLPPLALNPLPPSF